MQKWYVIRNRTTVIAETLKRKVVKDRTVIFCQRFASLVLRLRMQVFVEVARPD